MSDATYTGVTPSLGDIGGGAIGDFFTFRLDATRMDNFIRDLRGRFTSAVGSLHRAHLDMAYQIQLRMAQHLDTAIQAGIERRGAFLDTDRPRGILRPGKTHEQRLREVLLNDRNRFVGYGGFTVGIVEWLNTSPAAPYWLRLETGGANPSPYISLWPAKGLGGVKRGPRYLSSSKLGNITPARGNQRSRLEVETAPIPAYRYLSDGWKAGLRDLRGTGPNSAGRAYQRELLGVGLKLRITPA